MIEVEILFNEFEEQLDVDALKKAANFTNVTILNIEKQLGSEILIKVKTEKKESIFFFGQQYELNRQVNSNLIFFNKWRNAKKNILPLNGISAKKLLRAIKLNKRKKLS